VETLEGSENEITRLKRTQRSGAGRTNCDKDDRGVSIKKEKNPERKDQIFNPRRPDDLVLGKRILGKRVASKKVIKKQAHKRRKKVLSPELGRKRVSD